MIRYALRCGEGHRFDSWFASGDDFDRLSVSGHLACAVCGSGAVSKDLMAPGIAQGTSEGTSRNALPAASPDTLPDRPLRGPASPAEQAIAELRRRVEAEVENVGRDFPAEARRIHAGDAPARPIFGEARASDARALVEDGIPVAPLPWSSARKSN